MLPSTPKVSIGLPVYNGAQYLRPAIDSILSQTYTDFELIISDNASTDETPQICREYVSKDSRVHYYRNEENKGASANHNRVYRLSSGKYFKWASHDDILGSKFLEKCVEIMDSNESVVLCHSMTMRINEIGELLDNCEYGVRVDALKRSECFADIMSNRNLAWILLLGLIRSNALAKTRLFGGYISADRVLLGELSLLGPFRVVHEDLFFRREHSQSYTNKSRSNQDQRDWWAKVSKSALTLPYWRVLKENFESVRRSPLRWSERFSCNIQILKWVLAEGWVLMVCDLGVNFFGAKRTSRFMSPFRQLLIEMAGIK
jgi:glycosyltransferase involved in cell wall biosynthesis